MLYNLQFQLPYNKFCGLSILLYCSLIAISVICYMCNIVYNCCSDSDEMRKAVICVACYICNSKNNKPSTRRSNEAIITLYGLYVHIGILYNYVCISVSNGLVYWVLCVFKMSSAPTVISFTDMTSSPPAGIS